MSKYFKVTTSGVKFEGKGTHGSPFRIYLFESQTPYTIKIEDVKEACDILKFESASTDTVLYYRLKDTHELTVTNSKVGRMKLL